MEEVVEQEAVAEELELALPLEPRALPEAQVALLAAPQRADGDAGAGTVRPVRN